MGGLRIQSGDPSKEYSKDRIWGKWRS
jgi:hypothetical protein